MLINVAAISQAVQSPTHNWDNTLFMKSLYLNAPNVASYFWEKFFYKTTLTIVNPSGTKGAGVLYFRPGCATFTALPFSVVNRATFKGVV